MTPEAVSHTHVETDDLDRSVELLGALYTPVRPTRVDEPDHVHFAVSSTHLDGIAVDRVSHTSGYRLVADPMDFVSIVTFARGQAVYRAAGREVRVGHGQSLVLPAGEIVELEQSAFEMDFVTLPADRLQDRARALSGRPDLQLRFDLATSRSAADERAWRVTLRHLRAELGQNDATLGGPLFRHQLPLLLFDAVLAHFPSNASPPLRRTVWEGARAARRGVDFVNANAHLALTTADIAEAAEVGVPQIEAAFQQHRGLSPTAYLQQVRLQGAEHDLRERQQPGRAAMRTEEMSAIVSAWGFNSPARFARLHLETFGVPPAHVDHSGRG